MADIIKNCLITQSDAKVLKEYCVDSTNPLYKKYKGYNTSVNLEAKEVYNGYTGKVVMITGDSKYGFEVVVLLSIDKAIKYGNLTSVSVSLNDFIDIGTKIGEVRSWVKIEYMNTNTQNQYTFRVLNTQMYKDDPMKLLDSDVSVQTNYSEQYSQSGLIDTVDEFDDGFEPLVEFDSDNGSDD